MKVEVVPHSPKWRYNFQEESLWIRSMFSPSLVGIHHIGSTAIPGIYAKPVIDILVEVTDITAIDKKNAHMEKLGYEAMGDMESLEDATSGRMMQGATELIRCTFFKQVHQMSKGI